MSARVFGIDLVRRGLMHLSTSRHESGYDRVSARRLLDRIDRGEPFLDVLEEPPTAVFSVTMHWDRRDQDPRQARDVAIAQLHERGYVAIPVHPDTHTVYVGVWGDQPSDIRTQIAAVFADRSFFGIAVAGMT